MINEVTMIRRSFTLAAALTAGLVAADARATTSCSFSTVVGVSFGSYDVFGASPVDAAGSLSFSCQGVGASDTIVIDLGRGNASSFAPRHLLHGGDQLYYNLYLDAARATIWGDGTNGTSHYGPVTPASGVTVTVSVFGRIPAAQNVPIGSYGDTIVATILF